MTQYDLGKLPRHAEHGVGDGMMLVKAPTWLGSQQVPRKAGSSLSSLAFCNFDKTQQQISRAIYADKAVPTVAEIRLQKRLVKIFFLELL